MLLAEMFPTTEVASTSVSSSVPSMESEEIKLFRSSRPVGPNQAPEAPDTTLGQFDSWPSQSHLATA